MKFEGKLRQEKMVSKSAEEATSLLASIVESSDDAIMTATLDDIIRSWNPGAERLYGYKAEEIIGRNLSILIPENRENKMAELVDRIKHGEAVIQYQTIDQRKDGTRFHVSLTISPIKDREGNLTAVSCIARDVSLKREAEETLRASEEQYKALFYSNPLPMYVFDTETLQFLDINEATVAQYGYTREELLGMTIKGIRPAEDIPALMEDIKNRSQEPHRPGVWRHLKKDGSLIYVDITTQAMFYRGRPARVVLAIDVSEKLRAEDLEREVSALREMAKIMTSNLDLSQVFERFAEELKKLVPLDRMALIAVDKEKGTWRLTHAYGPGSVSVYDIGKTYPLAGSVTDYVFTNEATWVSNDLSEDDRSWTFKRFLEAGFRSCLHVPLKGKDGAIGVMGLLSRRAGAYGPREELLVNLLAAQIAPAIENSMLFQEARDARKEERLRSEELQALFDISRVLSGPGIFETKAAQVMESLVKVAQAGGATLRIIDERGVGLRMVTQAGAQGPEEPPVVATEGTLIGEAYRGARPMVLNKYQDHPRALPHFGKQGLRSVAFFPVKCGSQIPGVVIVNSREEGHFTADRVRLLTAITNGMGVLMENARLVEAERLRTRELQGLSRIPSILVEEGTFLEKARKALQVLLETVQEGHSALRVPDEAGTGLVLVAVAGKLFQGAITLPIEGSLTGESYSSGKTLALNDYLSHPKAQPYFKEQGLRSVVLLPVRVEGKILGVVSVDSTKKDQFTPERVAFLRAMVDGIGVLLENTRLIAEEKSRRQELEAVVNTSPVCLVLVDRNMTVRWVNRPASHDFGLEPEDLIGKNWYEAAPPARSYQDIHQRVLAGVEVNIDADRERYPFGDRGQYYDLRYRPLRDHEGHVSGMLLVFLNVTGRIKQEEQLKEASRLAAIGELAAGVAHELNNPLTSVVGFAELLQRRDLSQEAKEETAEILNGAQRAAKVVQNLLSFSRRRSPQKSVVDLEGILDAMISLVSHDLRANNIRLERQLNAELPFITADKHQLLQVLVNIMTNSIQAISEVKNEGRVLIRAWGEGLGVRLSITDDGPGIPENILHRIFDPFFTTKGVGKGTGLGLSICYGIVKEHGGRIWAESKPGEGAAIHIYLPTGKASPALEPSPSKPEELKTARGRVLVVDDEPAIRELITELLAEEGLTVEIASDGVQAQQEIRARDYDCILLDVKMPALNGKDLYRWIRERNEPLSRRVVFVTGDSLSRETEEFFKHVANAVITKPFSPQALKENVLKTLEARFSSN